MGESPIIFHEQYEKISDDIMYLGTNTILRMNVILAKKLDDGRRYPYHKEYMYETNKYIDTKNILTLRRGFDYYLSIENIKSLYNTEKEFIMIRVQDMIFIRQQLKIVYKWFVSDNCNVFAISDNKLIILDKVQPIVICGLASQKYISFEPTIIQYDDDNMIQGIRVHLSSDNNYVDMTIDRFMGFLYIINTINLYESAQLILNYIGRPDFGTNMIDYTKSDTSENFTRFRGNRQIPSTVRKKSFFDKVNEL